MPVLWRYLLSSYFKVFGLCVLAFISTLLVMRFSEIAQFATSGAPKLTIILFISLQIPYVLPFAIPISCLIAAVLLLQRLSHTQELTALRASGLGLKTITYPILLMGALLALLNFTFASEINPVCRGLTKKLIYEITTQNPLFVLQKDSMIKMKNIFFDMKMLHSAKGAEDVVIVMKNNGNGKLTIMTAKELSLTGAQLKGKQVTIISNATAKEENAFDHLIIENQETMSTKAANLSLGMQKTDWISSFDYMPLKMVIAKKIINKKSFGSLDLEIIRRFSIGLAAFTFTFIGVAFGMQLGRTHSKKGLMLAIALALFYLLAFIGAKSMRHSLAIPAILYLMPHPIIIFLSMKAIKRVSKGIE